MPDGTGGASRYWESPNRSKRRTEFGIGLLKADRIDSVRLYFAPGQSCQVPRCPASREHTGMEHHAMPDHPAAPPAECPTAQPRPASVTIVRSYEPDDERCLRALMFLLEYRPPVAIEEQCEGADAPDLRQSA
jgi:hypothetical protein